MSFDRLQSAGGRTTLNSPSSSALTSLTAGVTLASGGFDVTNSGLAAHQPYPPTDSQSVTLTDSATIPAIASTILVSATTARTGLILGAPSTLKTGTTIRIVNLSGSNHTFAATATSRVADGGNQRLISLTAQEFVYHAPNNLWYSSATK